MKSSVVKTTKFEFDNLCIKENVSFDFNFLLKAMPENAVLSAIDREGYTSEKTIVKLKFSGFSLGNELLIK